MIEREDGPVKHYRMKCNKCSKQTKRHAYEFYFERDAPVGWKEVNDGYSGGEGVHYCPECVASILGIEYKNSKKKEVIAKIGKSISLSDHDAVSRFLVRKSEHKLVIDLEEEGKLIITSNTAIKVEQEEK